MTTARGLFHMGSIVTGRQRLRFTLDPEPELAKAFAGADALELVPLPRLLGALVAAGLASRMAKGAGHKYIRKVPDGRGGWRYFYAVTGGRGLGHHEEFQPGAKFQLEHNGSAGHFEIMERKGSKVRIKHDETGHDEWVEAKALSGMLHEQHAKLVQAHAARTERNLETVRRHGSQRQRQRLEEHAKRYAHTAHLADGRAKTDAGHEVPHRHISGDDFESHTGEWDTDDHDDAARHHDSEAEAAGGSGDHRVAAEHRAAARRHRDAAHEKSKDQLWDNEKAAARELIDAFQSRHGEAARFLKPLEAGVKEEARVGNYSVFRTAQGLHSFTAPTDATNEQIAEAYIIQHLERLTADKRAAAFAEHGVEDDEIDHEKVLRAVRKAIRGDVLKSMKVGGITKLTEQQLEADKARREKKADEKKRAAPGQLTEAELEQRRELGRKRRKADADEPAKAKPKAEDEPAKPRQAKPDEPAKAKPAADHWEERHAGTLRQDGLTVEAANAAGLRSIHGVALRNVPDGDTVEIRSAGTLVNTAVKNGDSWTVTHEQGRKKGQSFEIEGERFIRNTRPATLKLYHRTKAPEDAPKPKRVAKPDDPATPRRRASKAEKERRALEDGLAGVLPRRAKSGRSGSRKFDLGQIPGSLGQLMRQADAHYMRTSRPDARGWSGRPDAHGGDAAKMERGHIEFLRDMATESDAHRGDTAAHLEAKIAEARKAGLSPIEAERTLAKYRERSNGSRGFNAGQVWTPRGMRLVTEADVRGALVGLAYSLHEKAGKTKAEPAPAKLRADVHDRLGRMDAHTKRMDEVIAAARKSAPDKVAELEAMRDGWQREHRDPWHGALPDGRGAKLAQGREADLEGMTGLEDLAEFNRRTDQARNAASTTVATMEKIARQAGALGTPDLAQHAPKGWSYDPNDFGEVHRHEDGTVLRIDQRPGDRGPWATIKTPSGRNMQLNAKRGASRFELEAAARDYMEKHHRAAQGLADGWKRTEAAHLGGMWDVYKHPSGDSVRISNNGGSGYSATVSDAKSGTQREIKPRTGSRFGTKTEAENAARMTMAQIHARHLAREAEEEARKASGQAPKAPEGPTVIRSHEKGHEKVGEARNAAIGAVQAYRDALGNPETPSHEIERLRGAARSAIQHIRGVKLRNSSKKAFQDRSHAAAIQFLNDVDAHAEALGEHRGVKYKPGALAAHVQGGGHLSDVRQGLDMALKTGDADMITPDHLKATIGKIPAHEAIHAIANDGTSFVRDDIKRAIYAAGHLAGRPNMGPPGAGWVNASQAVVDAAAAKGNSGAKAELEARRKASAILGQPHMAGPSPEHFGDHLATGASVQDLTAGLDALREKAAGGDHAARTELERRSFATQALGHGHLDELAEGGAKDPVWSGDRVQTEDGTTYVRRDNRMQPNKVEWAKIGDDGQPQRWGGKTRHELEKEHGRGAFSGAKARPDEAHHTTVGAFMEKNHGADRGRTIAAAIRHAAGATEDAAPIPSGDGHLPVEHLANLAEMHNRGTREKKHKVPFHELMTTEQLREVVGGKPEVGTPDFDRGSFHNELLARNHADMVGGVQTKRGEVSSGGKTLKGQVVGDGSLVVVKHGKGYATIHAASGGHIPALSGPTAGEAVYAAAYAQKHGAVPKSAAEITDAHKDVWRDAEAHVDAGIAKRAGELARDKAQGAAAVAGVNAAAAKAAELAKVAPKAAPKFNAPTEAQHTRDKAHRRALTIASNDASRPNLGGVFHGDQGAVATDGHRIVVIPTKGGAGDWHGTTRTKDGQALDTAFPDYRQVLGDPDKGHTHDVHDAKHLAAAVKTLSDLHRKAGNRIAGVNYVRRGGQAFLETQIADDATLPNDGKVSIPLGPTAHKDGAAFAVNAHYLKDALTGARGAVKISDKAALAPIHVRREDGERHTIMPMRM